MLLLCTWLVQVVMYVKHTDLNIKAMSIALLRKLATLTEYRQEVCVTSHSLAENRKNHQC